MIEQGEPMTSTRFCQRCEKWVRFGIHECTPARKAEASTAPKAPAVKNAEATINIPHSSIPHAIPHIPHKIEDKPVNAAAKRTKEWRAANLDKHRAYHRSYMRKRRAEAKASPDGAANVV
jgi:hypothetical protein